MRRAEVAVDALLHVPAFLSAHHEDFFAVEAGHTADDRRVIAKSAVAVDFAPVREQALNVVEGLGTLGMASEFSFLPSRLRGLQLLPQGMDPFMQLRQLAASVLILSCAGLNERHLALDVFQFLLWFIA